MIQGMSECSYDVAFDVEGVAGFAVLSLFLVEFGQTGAAYAVIVGR